MEIKNGDRKNLIRCTEDIKIIKNKIINIGSKINKSNLPKYQYMGLIKLKKVFVNMMEYFEKLKTKKLI